MQKTTDISSKKNIEILNILKEVCIDNLNEEYLFLAENLSREIFQLNEFKLSKSKANSWACGIVHALGQKNGLFNTKSDINIKAQDFYKLFNVSSSTGLAKSKEIRELIDLDNEKWTLTNNVNINKENKKDEALLEEKVEVENLESLFKEDEFLKEANKIARKAWQEKNYKKKVRLAKEALSLSENCSEAYIILSYDNSLNDNQKKDLAEKAVEVSKNIIGEENIDKFINKCLDYEVTNGYYSSKYRLGSLLWSIGEKEEAIKNFKELIKLCPNDRLLVRSILLSWLISVDRFDEAFEILEQYKNDNLLGTRLSRVLYLFKNNELEEAKRNLRLANSINPFVLKYIMKQKKVTTSHNEFKKLGSEEEAIFYMKYAEAAWDNVKGSREWVKEIKNEL